MSINYILNNSIPEPNTGCWLWLGALDDAGYGQGSHEGRNIRAHRLSYAAFNGSFPNDMALHICDVRSCVNPDHIYDGTHKQNMQDKVRRGRQQDQRGVKNPNYKHGRNRRIDDEGNRIRP